MADGALRLEAVIIHGDTPAELVKEFTGEFSGRMKALPKWAAGAGAIVGYVRHCSLITLLREGLLIY